MDQSNPDSFLPSLPRSSPSIIEFRQPPLPQDPRVPSTRTMPNSSQRPEAESTRKSQKADREKLRRDRLNEQFIDLGNTLDPDRPKNDKATILSDTVQLLKDLTAQVNKLKTEYSSLTEESRELTQEKNDLREEKASLKSDIDSLNAQYQQRVRASFPWAPMDHSMVMAPPYPYPMPVPMPAGPIPMHPSMQPYPFFANQNPGVIPNPCSTFVPYMTHNPLVEQQSTQNVSPLRALPGIRSNVSAKPDSRNKSSGESKIDRSVGSNDVTTDLELKTPGSTTDQDLSSGQRKTKKSLRKESSFTEGGSSSSRCSSSRSIQDSSSNSIVCGTKADEEEGRTKT